MCWNLGLCSAQGICKHIVSRMMHRYRGDVKHPGRYMILRSVAKSVAGSEDRMRGQPLGDSAAERLAWANVRRRTGEWRERTLV